MRLFDSHSHTAYSHDGRDSVEKLCKAALDKGLSGIAITDHAGAGLYQERDTYRNIVSSVSAARDACARYRGRLNVFAGVEMGEALWNPAAAEEVLRIPGIDAVLGSVHCVRYSGWERPFSVIDFSDWPAALIHEYLRQYFTDLLEMAETADYDVLAHLTVPLRYINGKYRRGASTAVFEDQIHDILRAVIARGKALELNTSGITEHGGIFMPEKDLLKRYRELGGNRITLGSDAHQAERLGAGFAQALTLLRECGFFGYGYYLGSGCIIRRRLSSQMAHTAL